MAKEMSHDVTDEITENLVSEVHTAKKLVPPVTSARAMQRDLSPPQSGIGNMGHVAPGERRIPGVLPALPRPPARKPAQGGPEQQLAVETHSKKGRASDKVLSNRSVPMDTKSRSNLPSTVSPGFKSTQLEVAVPKPPKVPTDIDVAKQPLQPVKPLRSVIPKLEDEEEQTRVCPAAVLQNLLSNDDVVESPQMQSLADEATRVGKITIEELAAAERKLSGSSIGHEDVTRTYSFDVAESSSSQVTAPGKHHIQAELQTEPRVIIQAQPPKRRFPWGMTATLVVAACAVVVGWTYRSSIDRSLRGWESSFMRGIGSTAHRQSTQQAPAPTVAMIALSISVSPADAVLTVDGARVSNPFSIQGRSDPLSHEIRAVAPGYVSLQRQVQFDRDLTMVLALAPIPPSIEAQRATQSSPPAVRTQPRAATARLAPKARSLVASAQPNCNPPYVVDAAGIKSYRPECL